MKRAKSYVGGLQWKLARSYTLATLISTCCFVVALTVLSDLYYTWNEQPQEEQEASQHYLATFKAEAVLYLTQSPVPQQELQGWLEGHVKSADPSSFLSLAPARGQLRALSVVSAAGLVLASVGPDAHKAGRELMPTLSAGQKRVLSLVMQTSQQRALTVEQDQSWFLAERVPGPKQRLLGVLLFHLQPPGLMSRLLHNLTTDLTLIIPQGLLGIMLSFPLLLLICLLAGMGMARHLIVRLQGLSIAAKNWSQGHFAFSVQEQAEDEFGILIRDLNVMARQLQALFSVQQQLIASEERNRLARDLHDSVKQQFYALGAQIQIANELCGQPHHVQRHLQEAILLLRSIQEEMNNLIQHLRPALLSEKGLRSALQDYVQTWSRLRGIAATFRQELPEDEQRGVLEPEQEEALFRVMQEALSNVARHSAAWSTEVRLASQGLETVLSIIDNGNGFDAEQIEPGFGMHSMQERLSALGGTVKITSVLGQGTAVVASIPALSKSEPFPGLPLPLVPEHSAQR